MEPNESAASPMTPEKYMTDRVDDQISYHSSRSKYSKTRFQTMRIVEILAAALIPFLAGYVTTMPIMQVAVGALGVLIAVITGALTLYSFEQNWMTSRATVEALSHEKVLFRTGAEPYNVENPFPLFVDKVETLLASEQSQWVARMQERRQERDRQAAENQPADA